MISAAQTAPAAGRTFEEGDEDVELLGALQHSKLRLRVLKGSDTESLHIVCFISSCSNSTAALVGGAGSSNGAGGAIAPYASALITALQLTTPAAVIEICNQSDRKVDHVADVYHSPHQQLLLVDVKADVPTEKAFSFVSLLLPPSGADESFNCAGLQSISVFGTFSISCCMSGSHEGSLRTVRSISAGDCSLLQPLLDIPVLEDGSVVSDLTAAWLAVAEMRQIPAAAVMIVTRAAVSLQSVQALQRNASIARFFSSLLPASGEGAGFSGPSADALRDAVRRDGFAMKTANLYC